MVYRVEPWIFERNPQVCFGILVGRGMTNTPTGEDDLRTLAEAEAALRQRLDGVSLKEHPDIQVYRDAIRQVGINPNKYMNSVEAMSKRIMKGQSLPRINALVDLCNAIGLKHVVSLGGHDLKDIQEDLAVRRSVDGDRFLPFGVEEWELVEPGEVVFTSGNTVQTRRWLWRQSELGKMTLETTNVFFQLVGFKGEHFVQMENAKRDLEELVRSRFGGSVQSYLVDQERPEITC
jgi:DNA/RNA-binding domain of Phe-tRNA-synthetase-like protein